MARVAAESQGDTPDARTRAAAFAAEYDGEMEELKTNPTKHAGLDILLFCRLREESLRRHGFPDPYVHIKGKENAAALALLPALLADLDVLAPPDRLKATVEGVFAGNIFDLGAIATIALYNSAAGIDFRATRANLRRPFLIDDYELFANTLGDASPYKKAVLFVDNAGSDVVLGMIPFARELLRRGSLVVIAANSLPSVNDITYAELLPLLEHAAQSDDLLRSAITEGRLTAVPSGNALPAIDLSQVSEELAAAAADADLVVLEGMGRAVETNLNACFTVDALKLAMVKHSEVAAFLGGSLLDVVCKFDRH